MSDVFPYDRFALPGLLSLAGMHQIIRFSLQVGHARRKYHVPVPKTAGPEEFVRVFRAHQNALESYSMAITALWIASVFGHPVPASILYGGYLIGREWSFWGYCESSEKRLPGLYFSYRCVLGLLAMVLAGTTNSLIRYYRNVDLGLMLTDRITLMRT